MAFTIGEVVTVRGYTGTVTEYLRHGAEDAPATLRMRLENGVVLRIPVTQSDLQEDRAQLVTRDVPGPTDERRRGPGRPKKA